MENEPQTPTTEQLNANQYVGRVAVTYEASVYSDDEPFPFAD